MPDEIWRQPTPEEKQQILRWFLEGQSINHIVFLLNYAVRSDYVSETVREEMRRLKREAACPCCRDGITLEGQTCTECHGKGLACIAYEVCRVHWKLLNDEKWRIEQALARYQINLSGRLIDHVRRLAGPSEKVVEVSSFTAMRVMEDGSAILYRCPLGVIIDVPLSPTDIAAIKAL